MADPTNDFDIAKSINDLLSPLPADRQQRILRWVAESLDVSLNVRHSSPAHSAPPPSGQLGTATAAPAGGTDIKSFVESKAPNSDVQFAAVVAYYYRFEAAADQRSDTITPATLQDSTRLVGRARLGDPGKTLNNAKGLGYLDRPERGEFAINTVGENLVAMTLPGGTVEAAPKRKRKKANSKKTATGKAAKKKSRK